jgi:hypothetical protein
VCGVLLVFVAACGGSSASSPDGVDATSTTLNPMEVTTTTLNPMEAARAEFQRIDEEMTPLRNAVAAFQSESMNLPWSEFPSYCDALATYYGTRARLIAAYKWPDEVSDEADAFAKSLARLVAVAQICKGSPGKSDPQERLSREIFGMNEVSRGLLAEFKLVLGL